MRTAKETNAMSRWCTSSPACGIVGFSAPKSPTTRTVLREDSSHLLRLPLPLPLLPPLLLLQVRFAFRVNLSLLVFNGQNHCLFSKKKKSSRGERAMDAVSAAPVQRCAHQDRSHHHQQLGA